MSGYINLSQLYIVDVRCYLGKFDQLRTIRRVAFSGKILEMDMAFGEDLKTRLKKEISVLNICLDFCWGSEYEGCKKDISLRRRIIELL